jgi:hypothetical protein
VAELQRGPPAYIACHESTVHGNERIVLFWGSWRISNDDSGIPRNERCQNKESPAGAGLSQKRLKRLELSTFCMASRRWIADSALSLEVGSA